MTNGITRDGREGTSPNVPAPATSDSSQPPSGVWTSLEIAKLVVPIVQALGLAAVGLWISWDIERSKVDLAEEARKQYTLPNLLLTFRSNFNSEDVDGRAAGLRTYNAYLRVVLKNDEVVEGWPLQFAYGTGGYEIWLSPACTLAGTAVTRVPGPGTLLFQSEIHRIDVIDQAASRCSNEWHNVPEPDDPAAAKLRAANAALESAITDLKQYGTTRQGHRADWRSGTK